MQTHVLEYLERTLQRHPNRVALVDGERSFTFAEASQRVRNIAAAIRCENRPVAIYLPKSADAVLAQWAVLASGNFYAPLDVKSPAARTKKIVDKLGPALTVTDSAGAQSVSGEVLIIDDVPDAPPRSLVPPHRIDTDPAYVIFTSGSTGEPKGVTISHRGIIDYIDWAVSTFEFDSSTTIGNQSPLFFDNSTLDLYVTLATGATLVLIPETAFAFPLRLVELLARLEISMIFWVPSVMVQVANLDVLRGVPLPALRDVLFAGEVMPNKQLNHWRRALPHARFANLYGPTEITVDCTYFIVDRDFRDDEPLPIGVPCRNTDVLIIDGELCVRGSSLALGYWNDPEKTAAAFTQNPLNPHYPERIYRTGDLVHRNDRGEIMFAGRKDHQIKHLGYRIELGEIETAAGAAEGIHNVCALYDDERKEINLFFESGVGVTPATLRQTLSRDLPKYMVPTAYHRLDELPRNANGKIDRLALAQRLRA
ncbi:MAG TPA: amino acid adenylation domain-containing protein [Thermoanaerobaculia bacterium]